METKFIPISSLCRLEMTSYGDGLVSRDLCISYVERQNDPYFSSMDTDAYITMETAKQMREMLDEWIQHEEKLKGHGNGDGDPQPGHEEIGSGSEQDVDIVGADDRDHV